MIGPEAQCLRAPIVLVHGLLGFARVHLGPWELAHYFPGIEEWLQFAGNRVAEARLSLTRGVADRAHELRRFIRAAFPNEPVHILAHSMGGLDARYMISRLDMADRVLTLTTFGTPHRGCTFADWGLQKFNWMIRPFFRLFGMCDRAFADLTTDSCRRFNEEVLDAPGVRYFSVAGRCDTSLVRPPYWLPHRIVSEREGPNDSIVSLTTASYGEAFEVWESDHLSLVNWPNRKAHARGLWRDRLADYGRVVERLAALGY
jgi:triacylglycerol lipase